MSLSYYKNYYKNYYVDNSNELNDLETLERFIRKQAKSYAKEKYGHSCCDKSKNNEPKVLNAPFDRVIYQQAKEEQKPQQFIQPSDEVLQSQVAILDQIKKDQEEDKAKIQEMPEKVETEAEEKAIEKEEKEEKECNICMEKQKNCAFVPCGHIASCFDCANEIQNKGQTCPACRAPIQTVLKLYDV